MPALRKRSEGAKPVEARRRSNAPSKGHASTLPIEIWILILREAQYDDLQPRYRWLRRYSLVCSAWRPYAQELLFAHVALRGSGHCKAFQRAVLSPHDPAHGLRLRRAVRTLSMVMDHQQIYPAVIGLCPALRELHLCMYHASFRADVLAALASAIPRTVRALRVRSYHYAALFQLLALVPHIEYLEVDCNSANAPMPHPIPCDPPRWRLRELRYTNLRRGTHALVEWALSGPGEGSRDALEALRVQCPSFNPSVLPMLGVSRLRSLAIPRVANGDDLSVLTHIEELWMTAPRYPTPTFLPLPASVRHLALHPLAGATEVDYESIEAELSAFYEQAGAHLEVVTYHRRCDEDDESVEDVRMLYDFCKARNLEFRLMDPPYGYYAGERIPFEPIGQCPRPAPQSSRRSTEQGRVVSILTAPRKKPTLTRKLARSAKRAFGSTIPPAALARPA
ncbi:hypothetical protein GY45DRAFT_1319009 [Cubamyces sp. BRFM 1775]|nr:hypothetical protein GY45DRAFT_1319009 [Cubamyces sp. BRFM 1775]